MAALFKFYILQGCFSIHNGMEKSKVMQNYPGSPPWKKGGRRREGMRLGIPEGIFRGEIIISWLFLNQIKSCVICIPVTMSSWSSAGPESSISPSLLVHIFVAFD